MLTALTLDFFIEQMKFWYQNMVTAEYLRLHKNTMAFRRTTFPSDYLL